MYLICLFLVLAGPTVQVNSLLQEGLTALQQGRFSDARKSLEQASTVDPKNPYIWTSLAETYFRMKDPRHAQAAAQSAEQVGAGDPIVSHALAMYYSESGNFARAAELEARFAESPKADGDANARAAALYLNAGELQKGLALARKAVTQRASAANESLLGRALVASGDSKGGSEHLRSAWELARTDPAIAFDYAQALFRDQDFGTAADVLSPALEAHADNAQLVLAMGVTRYGQRRFEDSIVLFLRVIRLDPSIQQPYTFLGQILEQAGSHLSEITSVYQTWVRREPKNAKANFFLAKAILATGGNDEAAEDLLRRSIALEGGRWESHYELGVLQLKKHKYDAALAELIRSVELEPRQPTVHYQLARVYDRLGQPEKAKAEREIHGRLTSSETPTSRR